MSTDVTRGPKVCPSCGRENSASATRCTACFTALDGAVQATPPAPPSDVYDPDHFRAFPHRGAADGCYKATIWFGVILLTLVSGGITFFLTCYAVVVGSGDPLGHPGLAVIVAMLAGGAVAVLVLIYATRRLMRP